MHAHVGCHFVRLPLCCHLLHCNKMKWNIGSTSTAIPPASASDVVGQHHNKIEGTTYGAAILQAFFSELRKTVI